MDIAKFKDKEGRKRIFEILTRDLRENKRLGNINLNVLANKTEKFSGADIEAVVKAASLSSLERLSIKKTNSEEIKESDYFITQKDFLDSIETIGKDKNQDNIIPYMYS